MNLDLRILSYSYTILLMWPLQAGASIPEKAVLYSPDEEITITDRSKAYCGAEMGRKHYTGSYLLAYKNSIAALNSGNKMDFDEGTDHDKKITLNEHIESQGISLFSYVQHGSCSYKILVFLRYVDGRGFDARPVKFCETHNRCKDYVVQSPHFGWPVNPAICKGNKLITRRISQDNNLFYYKMWKYDNSNNAFYEISEWKESH